MAGINGSDIVKKMGGNSVQKNEIVSVKSLLSKINYKQRFEEILGNNAAGFISSVINTVQSDTNLEKVDPNTVISSAVVAATLDLPVDKNLGFAYIVPYGGKAQFQMGYRGYIQLAIRTGQYKTMNVSDVYEDELESYNPITEEIRFSNMDNWNQRDSGENSKIVGYYFSFELLNGFRKSLYMSKKQIETHAKKYSKSFSNSNGRWKQDFDAMAKKTVIRLCLPKWGIMSVEMKNAMQADQAVINNPDLGQPGATEYVDNVNYTVEDTNEYATKPGDDVPGFVQDGDNY